MHYTASLLGLHLVNLLPHLGLLSCCSFPHLVESKPDISLQDTLIRIGIYFPLHGKVVQVQKQQHSSKSNASIIVLYCSKDVFVLMQNSTQFKFHLFDPFSYNQYCGGKSRCSLANFILQCFIWRATTSSVVYCQGYNACFSHG